MSSWLPTITRNAGGYHRVVATPPGGTPVDITFLRGAPTQIGSYASADPFSDSVAQITFPQLGQWDDFSSPELNWLHEDTNIDIWWIPALPKPLGWPAGGAGDLATWRNPLSDQLDIIAPAFSYFPSGTGGWTRGHWRGTKVWEGFIASIEVSGDATSSTIAVSLQGALFQADLTLAKPFFPARPQAVEDLILGVFDHAKNPSLSTAAPIIQWPSDWTLVAPAFTGSSNTFDPNVSPGAKWTGYTTRQTGGWDHALTSFIQNLLAVMLVKSGSGTPPGSQWTLRNLLQGDPAAPAGRTPALMVRDRSVAPAVTMWVGTQGLNLSLTRDATQEENSLYGTGTDIGGTTWRNAVIASDGSRTDYLPLAASPQVYPAQDNPRLNSGKYLRESYVQFGTGFSQSDALESAGQMLARDLDAGWSGTVTLTTDPSDTVSRWTLRAGITLLLKGFMGSGETGTRFHVAQVEADPTAGTVTLTVDTRYRDMITLNEALNRTRDALTPAKLLQLNRNSVTIEDIQAPWDYSAGSGCIPTSVKAIYDYKPSTSLYPYTDFIKTYAEPATHPEFFVLCQANNPDSQKRWAGPVPVLMAEKGTIRRSEFWMVDQYGNLILDRFHVSLYYNNGINATFMPNDGHTWSPFIPGAFQSIDPSTGEPWAVPGLAPDQSMVIAWGNADQPAGYSPGLFTDGAQPTGLLVDESSWTFDCSANNPNYDHLAQAGKEVASVISVYAMFYAEHPTPVYFGGRLFREEPGSTS